MTTLKEMKITKRNPVTGRFEVETIKFYHMEWITGTSLPTMFGQYQINPGSKNKIHTFSGRCERTGSFWDLPLTMKHMGKVAHLVG